MNIDIGVLTYEKKEEIYTRKYPKIEFKYAKKNTILNIQTTLQGYCAELFILKKV